jgi:hypothetical protein
MTTHDYLIRDVIFPALYDHAADQKHVATIAQRTLNNLAFECLAKRE